MRGSVVKRLLLVIPVVLALTLVSLFMPARRLSIEGIGTLSFETTVTLSVGSEVAYAAPDSLTNPPSANSGGWANPTNAYADGGGYASITSGTPSASHTYSNYGFSLTGDTITQVRVRTDAWSIGSAGLTTSKNPTANTNGSLPWTTPANGYTSNNQYATVSPTYGSTTSKNPTANANGTLPWTTPANGYTSNNQYATVSPTYGATTSNNPTANTNGTNPWTNPANGYTSNNSYATAPSTIPTFRSVGTQALGTTSAVTPGLPGSMQANDICILSASTIAGGSISITVNGSVGTWTAVSGSPIDVTGGEKLYVWWGRWSSGTTAPSVQASTDHINSVITAFYNCYAGGAPVDVSATGTDTNSTTTFSFATGLTSTYNNELVICVCSTGNDSTNAQFTPMANTSLTSLAERYDDTTSNGGGGGFALAQGARVTAGTLGTFTSTLSNASPKAYIAFALLATVPNNTFDQIYGTFAITDPGTSSTITKVELGYEAFATATQSLDLYTSTNGGSSWSSAHNTGNLATSDPGTYTYIDVTADYSWSWTLLNDTYFKYKIVTHWLSGTPTWSVDALVVRVTYDDRRAYDQIYGTFAITDPGTSSTITKVELGYEAFATATGKLDLYTSENGGAGWHSIHTTADLGTSDPDSYTYIDVTGDTTWTWTLLNDTNFKVKVITKWVSGTPAWSLDALVVRVTYDDRRGYDQIYGTFGITGTGTVTMVEVGYEAFATATGKLDLYTSENGGAGWHAVHTTADLGTSDPDSYTYIEVTSDTSWTWTLLNDTNFKYKVVTNWVSGTPAWSVDALIVRVTYTAANDEQIRMDVSWDGGTSWSVSKHTQDLTGTETTYWVDVTSDTSWTPTKLSDANFQVRVDAMTVGPDSGDVRLDWIPVEVTYTVPSIIIPAPTSKAFGVVQPSTDYWSNGGSNPFPNLIDDECYFTVTNNGSIPVNISIKATNFTGATGGWTLASSPGENIVTLKAGKSGDALETNMFILTTSEQPSFITGLGAGLPKKWEIKLETGTFTEGSDKTSTITLTATAA
jgi:hypothetical protein